MSHEEIQLMKDLMKHGKKLLFCDLGNILIGKDKINENVYLEGGGDWDFTLATFSINKTRQEFDNILMCGNQYYYKIIDPHNWCEICNIIGIHFATKEYIWKKNKNGKTKTECVSYIHDATGFESYLHFDELYDWHIIDDDGNFLKITCEWKNKNPNTYVLFAFATS